MPLAGLCDPLGLCHVQAALAWGNAKGIQGQGPARAKASLPHLGFSAEATALVRATLSIWASLRVPAATATRLP